MFFHGLYHGLVVLDGGALLDEVQHTADLLIPHKGTLDTGGLGCAHGHEEHIAHAQQLFGTGTVEDGAAVHLTGHGEGDAAGDVGLDEAGDDVHAGALGRHDEVHTGGAGLLGDAADGVLDILADDHHQIGQLVDDDGDIGHLLEVRVRCRQLIEGLDVADVVLREEVVAALHLLHCAAQCAGRLAGLGDDGHQQVGDAVVLSQLDDLGVDEQELDVLGAGAEQQAHDDAVDTDRFAAAGAARDEQMGHLAQVGHLSHAGDVLAQRNAHRRGHPQKALALEDAADVDRRFLMVRHLDAHGRLAGDGCLHADIGHRQVQGDVVRQRSDAAYLDARHGLDFIPGDRRAAGNIQHTGADAEAFQRVHQLLGVGFQLVFRAGVAFLRGALEQLDGRVLILEALLRLGLFGGGVRGLLLGDSGLFHGGCHQRVEVFFLHRVAGDADPAVLIRLRAECRSILGADRLRGRFRSRGQIIERDAEGERRLRRGLLFRLFCRGGGRDSRCHRRLGLGREEVLGGGIHSVRDDGRHGGADGRTAERVHAEGAAGAEDDGLDGLTAALGDGGMVRA